MLLCSRQVILKKTPTNWTWKNSYVVIERAIFGTVFWFLARLPVLKEMLPIKIYCHFWSSDLCQWSSSQAVVNWWTIICLLHCRRIKQHNFLGLEWLVLEVRHPYLHTVAQPWLGMRHVYGGEVAWPNMQGARWMLREPACCLCPPWAAHLTALCLSFSFYLLHNLFIQMSNSLKWDCLSLFKTALLQLSLSNKQL